MKTNKSLILIVLVLVGLWFLFRSIEKDEGMDLDTNFDKMRLGPRYQYGPNNDVNLFIDGINHGVDIAMQSACSNTVAANNSTNSFINSLPSTCTKAFSQIPTQFNNMTPTLRSSFCNTDDTLNKPKLQKFLKDMTGSLCPY